jgi:membrane protease YdiL (CAAX protease family)
MENKPGEQLQKGDNEMYPALQFLVFAAIVAGAIITGGIISAAIIIGLYGEKSLVALSTSDATDPHFVGSLWILQIAGTTLPLLASTTFFVTVIVKNTQDYIKPFFRIHWVLLLLVFAIMLSSSPLIEFLSIINAKIDLPKWMRDYESSVEKLTGVMLQMKTVWNLIFDIFFIGLLTAIVEETMFRGVIQTIFAKWTKNAHATVWITAAIFSAFHMEFSGFLPRMLLGAMFGYLVVWSGSIWPAVWAHFINNAVAVIETYMQQHKLIAANFDLQQSFNNTAYVFSFIIVLFLFWIYRDTGLKKLRVYQ